MRLPERWRQTKSIAGGDGEDKFENFDARATVRMLPAYKLVGTEGRRASLHRWMVDANFSLIGLPGHKGTPMFELTEKQAREVVIKNMRQVSRDYHAYINAPQGGEDREIERKGNVIASYSEYAEAARLASKMGAGTTVRFNAKTQEHEVLPRGN